MSQKRAGKNLIESKCHSVTVRPEICVKMFMFKVDVQSVHLETKCSWVKFSQGKMSLWMFKVGINVMVDEMWVDVMSRHRSCTLRILNLAGVVLFVS
jgi:hypothetical protein